MLSGSIVADRLEQRTLRGLYPRLLPSSGDPALDITIAKAISGPYALHVGLIWWVLGMALAILYFAVVYRMFRGKVSLGDGYGH